MNRPAVRKAFTSLEATATWPCARPLLRQTYRGISNESLQRAVPTVATVSFWQSLIPKPFRRDARSGKNVSVKSKDWNPATFYIAMFILIGSMSMQQIALKRDAETFLRQSDVKIGRLAEVVRRLQNGEKFDVEGALGTGNPAAEQEWEKMLKDIEKAGPLGKDREDQQSTRRSRSSRRKPEEKERTEPTVKAVSTSSFY